MDLQFIAVKVYKIAKRDLTARAFLNWENKQFESCLSFPHEKKMKKWDVTFSTVIKKIKTLKSFFFNEIYSTL